MYEPTPNELTLTLTCRLCGDLLCVDLAYPGRDTCTDCICEQNRELAREQLDQLRERVAESIL